MITKEIRFTTLLILLLPTLLIVLFFWIVGPTTLVSVPLTEIVAPEKITEPTKSNRQKFMIPGEATLAMGTNPLPLVWPVHHIQNIYSFDSSGRKFNYTEDKDWKISNGIIRRTADSTIPDFGDYTYIAGTACSLSLFSRECARSILRCVLDMQIYQCVSSSNRSKFAFSAEPRNPPLSIEYNIYVDYETLFSSGTTVTIPAKREDVAPFDSVLCLGDSITAGSHTVDHYYSNEDSGSWCGLLRDTFKTHAQFKNISLPGGHVDYLSTNIDKFVSERADIAIVNVGMNDHMRGIEQTADFEEQLLEIAIKFKQNGTQTIFIGFFQQNTLWKEENTAASILFDKAISNAAQNSNSIFVDISSIFKAAYPENFSSIIWTADFMHHPNNFGHKVYASAILPYLLTNAQPILNVPYYVPINTIPTRQ